MDEVLKDSNLPEDIKSQRYNDLPQDYKFTMSKSKQPANPANLPVHQNALMTRTTRSLPASTLIRMIPSSSSSTENVVQDPELVEEMPSTLVTPRPQIYRKIPNISPPRI